MARLRPVLLWLGIAAVLAARSWAHLDAPILGHEDGTIQLAFFFNQPDFAGIFRRYAGYVSLLPNLAGWAASLLPLPAIPFALAGFALACATSSLFLATTARWRFLVASDRARAALALVLAALPLGKAYLSTNSVYAQWSLLLLLTLLVAGPAPRSRGGLVALLAASHPLSAVCLAVCAGNLWLFRTRRDLLCNGWTAVCVALYLAVGVGSGADIDLSAGRWALGFQTFLARVCLECLAGGEPTGALLRGEAWAAFVLGGALLALYLGNVAALAPPAWRLGHFLLLGASLGLVVVSCLARPEYGADLFLRTPEMQRYLYASKALFAFGLLASFAQRFAPRPEMRLAHGLYGLCAGLLLFAAWRGNEALYGSWPEERKAVASFLRRAQDELDAARAGRPFAGRVYLPRPGGWDISLDIESRAAVRQVER